MGKTKMNFIIEKDNQQLTLNNITPMLADLKKEAEKFFSVAPGSYKVSYLDIDNDPIAVEDDDDLAVCILEFSEMSKIDEPVVLVIESQDKNIPRRVDSPKGSGKASPRLAKSELVAPSVNLEEKNQIRAKVEHIKTEQDNMSTFSFDETASQLSEKVISMVESKVSEKLTSKLEEIMSDKIAKTIEETMKKAEAQREKIRNEKKAAEKKLKEEKNKRKEEEKLRKEEEKLRKEEAKLRKEEEKKRKELEKKAQEEKKKAD